MASSTRPTPAVALDQQAREASHVTDTTEEGSADNAPDARRALEWALEYLRAQQRDENHWVGVLSSSALATSMSITALWTVDRAHYGDRIARGRQWLFATQNDDGGWGDAVVDPSNINATSLAIAALTLTREAREKSQPARAGATTEAGKMPAIPGGRTTPTRAGGEFNEAERDPMRRAHARLDAFGGYETVGDPDRCTLSGPCRTVSAMAGLMDWRTIKRLRPEVLLLPVRLRRTISTTFPAYLSISTLHTVMAPHPLNHAPTYRMTLPRVMEWLRQAQGPNGSFEESAFLSSVIISCLTAAGYGDLPWLPDAIRFVVESQREDGGWPIDRDLETFDTDLTVFAFHEAGQPVPNAARVRDWLLARQIEEVCFPTGARPGGWAWAMPAGWPDGDDTSYTMLALRLLGVPPSAPSIRRGARWMEWMQAREGSWSTFVRGSRMPFDHDCPYITGHALSALHAAGRLGERSETLRKALTYLKRAQRHDGSFASIWFREATAGTASVLEALADCGLANAPMAARAVQALLRSQNDDGGWAGLRLQASTAEETSWAVLALLRCPKDEQVAEAVRRGIDWLVAHQQADGTWIPAPIGLYYSAMWYSDSYYAVALPARALARAGARHDAS